MSAEIQKYQEEPPMESVDQDCQVIQEKIQELCQQIAGEDSNPVAQPFVTEVEFGSSEIGWVRLCSLYNLDELEQSILLVCIAWELDSSFRSLVIEKVESTARYPCIELFFSLFCSSMKDRREVLVRCMQNSKLWSYKILTNTGDASNGKQFTLVTVDEHILQYLLGGSNLDPLTNPFLTPLSTVTRFDQENRRNYESETIRNLVDELDLRTHQGEPALVQIHGPSAEKVHETVVSICTELSIPLLKFDCSRLEDQIAHQSADITRDDIIIRTVREAALRGAAVILDSFSSLEKSARNIQTFENDFLDSLREHRLISFITGGANFDITQTVNNRANYFEVELQMPDFETRRLLWSTTLSELPTKPDIHLPEILASRFRMTGEQIIGAAAYARNRALLNAGQTESVSQDDILAGCRKNSNRRLNQLATKISTHFEWKDLVLAPDKIAQLREACAHIEHRERVYDTWEFESTSGSSRGLNVLFSGPPGTGKTMAAAIIAKELGLDIYRIDLSTVISKYIGETEKNLSRIFLEAETANAVLFFDEADALFGKRGEVQNANDRYANIEVGYLLQRMEAYSGMTILATNLSENMDDAFRRRLHFIVDFAPPDPEGRLKIWKLALPEAAPIDDDMDLEFLAQKLQLTGAGIKNVATQAAFYAATDSATANTPIPIGMAHVIMAAKRELAKEGRFLMPSDLGKYSQFLSTDVD